MCVLLQSNTLYKIAFALKPVPVYLLLHCVVV